MPDNRIVLLDNIIGKKIYLIGEDGKAIKDYGLAGSGIENPASVHGIYVVNLDCDLDGVWTDSGGKNRRVLTRLADIEGNPDPDRIGLVGRFTYTYDRMMEAEVAGDFSVEVCAHDMATTKDSYTESTVMHDLLVDHIIGFDADKAGNFYLVTSTLEESIKNNKRTFKAQNIATVINRSGVIEKQFEVYVQNRSEYVFKPVRVSEDGKLYYMVLDDEGLVILMYDPWK